MAIQAFVMNCFGCLDNLAWIWVLEKDVKGKGGRELQPTDVGLGKKYVLNSFSRQFRDYLDRRRDWFANLIGFRDSLAHRITEDAEGVRHVRGDGSRCLGAIVFNVKEFSR
jgi:hypothetical protein